MKKTAKHLCLIDGSGYVFRAFFGYPQLTRPDGVPVNAVYGFCAMITKLLRDMHAGYVGVIFDKGRCSFRNEIYGRYKADRRETPADLIPQFPLIRKACRAYNIASFEMDNFEADDLIATYAKRWENIGARVDIVTSDKDLMQLVTDNVTLFDPVKNQVIDRDRVKERFGVYPHNVIDVQSLAGDGVDNVPGVPGIGIKIAAQLINTYGNLDTVLEKTSEIKQPKRRENLIKFADQARLSRRLVTLKSDIDVQQDIDFFRRREADPAFLREFLLENNFTSLLLSLDDKDTVITDCKRPARRDTPSSFATAIDSKPPLYLGASIGDGTRQKADFEDPKIGRAFKINVAEDDSYFKQSVHDKCADDGEGREPPLDHTCISDEKTLKGWLAQARKTGLLVMDIKATSPHVLDAEIVGFSLCHTAGVACYVPLAHAHKNSPSPTPSTSEKRGQEKQEHSLQRHMNLQEFLNIIDSFMQDTSILKIGHNLKCVISVLRRFGLSINGFDDVMLLSFCCDAGLGEHHIKALVERHLSKDIYKRHLRFEGVHGKGKSVVAFQDADLHSVTCNMCQSADVIFRLHAILKRRAIHKKVMGIYQGIELPLIAAISSMERAGIAIDCGQLRMLSEEFAKNIDLLQDIVATWAEPYVGKDFNLASPKQLGELLFTHLAVDGGKKLKSGSYATNATVLDRIKHQHPVVETILKYRFYYKMKSTYTDVLPRKVNRVTNRLYTSYNMVGAQTGRLSSTDPNVQNIPVRDKEGRALRRCFVASKGMRLVSLDYSQMELRIAAHMSDDSIMIRAFQQGVDIHARMASTVFSVPEASVTVDLRNRAKAINFGILYGASTYGLARQIGCGRLEAKQLMEEYFNKFPRIKKFIDRVDDNISVHRKGVSVDSMYATTLFGRRIHFPGIDSKNAAVRAHAKRQMINAPVQGTAADIIKRAMIKIHKAIGDDPHRKPVLQVHDELVFEVHKDKVDSFVAMATEIMETAADPVVTMKVPLVVAAGVGNNWYQAHERS